MADLLVIVPTRGRPGNARRVLEAWDATGAWADAALVFAGDADDPQIGGYRRLADERRDDHRYWWLTELPAWEPMVSKLNKVATREARNFWALGFAGDDHLPRTPGWARSYLDALRELGTGIVFGNDLLQGERLPTQWAMTADIVTALGRMVPAPVEHLDSDSSIHALGRAAGCIRYLSDVVVEHVHPAAGKAPEDDQYRHWNRPIQVKKDRRAYDLWRSAQLAKDATQVRALREVSRGRPGDDQ